MAAIPGPRDYGTGTERALFHYSSGSCYFPGCTRPILENVEGIFVVAVDIAHIRGAKPGSARYDPTMTNDQRRAFANLILLCGPHHKLVDRLAPDDYPPQTLEQWKTESEPSGLARTVASGLTEAHLVAFIEQFAALHLTRTADVEVLGGIVTHRDGVAAMSLDMLQTVGEFNPELADLERVVVVDIRNTGSLPIVVGSIGLAVNLEDPASGASFETELLGRDDFPGTNATLPYQIAAGSSLQWFTKLSTLSALGEYVGSSRLRPLVITASVRLGSGERLTSAAAKLGVA